MLRILIFLLFSYVASADFIEDYKISNDLFKADIFSLENRSFYIKSDLLTHGNIKSKLNEVKDLQEKNDSLEIERFISDNKNKLYVFKLNLEAGVKLFSMNNATDKFTMYFKTLYDYSVMGGIGRREVSRSDFNNFFSSEIPRDLKDFIGGLQAGEDVVLLCRESSLAAETKSFCNNLPLGTYIVPSSMEMEVLTLLSKKDLKVGLFNVFTSSRFFSYFNLYGLNREEVYRFVGRDQVGSGSIYQDKVSNSRWWLNLDYLLGYNFTKESMAFISFEEIKVVDLTKAKEGSKEQVYGNPTLMKIQTQSQFGSLTTLLGVQSRGDKASGYIGGEVKQGDFNYKILASSSYLSVAPRYNYKNFSVEYSHYFPVGKLGQWENQDLDKLSLNLDF